MEQRHQSRDGAERLKQVLGAVGMGTFVWRIDDGGIEADARMREMFGLAPGAELTAEAMRAQVHPTHRDRHAQAVAAALDPARNGGLHEELRLVDDDGGERWLALHGLVEFAGSPRRAVQMLGVAIDISAQKSSEAHARESEAREAFLLELSDALRPLSDPVEIQAAATRVLGERLSVTRALYLEVESDPDSEYYVIRKDFFQPGLTSFVGRHRAADIGTSLLGELRAGRTLIVPDVAAETRLTEHERHTRAASGIQSYVAVPLVKHDRYVGCIAVFMAKPHAWSGDEIALIEETGARTWAAVERGKAEDALRASEARLATELGDTRVLQDFSAELIQQDGVDALYEKLVDAAMAIARADFASLQMLRAGADGNELLLLRSRGFDAEATAFFRSVDEFSATSCGHALRLRNRYVVPDVEQHDYSEHPELLATYRRLGIRAIQTTPLVSRGGNLVGMLSTHWRKPHVPTDSELNLFDILMRQAADLIDHRCNEAALRENEERLRMIADNMAQLAWTCDRPGDVTWYNKRWYEYTGLTFEQSRGWGWMQVVHPDHLDRVTAHIQRSGASGEAWEDTFPLRRHDGEYRWFLAQVVPIRDASGAIVRWFGTNTDISAQRAAEQALQDADRRKDEFLAMLAHELRNPLAPVRNALEILKLNGTSQHAVESAAAVLDRQVRQMSRLIDDLLDVSRITRGKISLRVKRIELNPIIADASEAARPLCDNRDLHLTLTVPAKPVYVDADPARLTQVVGNLLNNACKFTERGGSIRLLVEEAAGEVTIRVQDTGIGIAPDQLSRVFDLFTQIDTSLERSQTGLGIGLTLVRNLVELHGGSVEARSEGLSRGSEFVVRLPVASAPLKPLPAKPPAPAQATLRRRFLVVDDNADAATSLEQYLHLFGHDVTVAFDGMEAVAAARESMPDIILLDVGLPRLNGYEAARRIRALPGGAGPAIVAVTGWGQEEDRRESASAGFDAHLVKPVDPAALLDMLDDLEKRRNEAPQRMHHAARPA
jgi:PAS domain S-box-containing protein